MAKDGNEKFTKLVWLTLPLLVVVVAGFVLIPFAFDSLQYTFLYQSFLLGAAGWWAALVIRVPLILTGKAIKLSDAKLQVWSVAISGPCEEGIRVLVVTIQRYWASESFPNPNLFTLLYNTGTGWAGIEVVFVIFQGLAMVKLLRDDSDKAKEALAQLEQLQGEAVADTNPLLGAVERVWASGIHVGLTLALAYSPYLAVGFAIFHTGVNISVLLLRKRYGTLTAEVVLGIPVMIGFVVLAYFAAETFA